MSRLCTKCQVEKPLGQFHKGKNYHCKSCRTEYNKTYGRLNYQRHKASRRAASLLRHHNNRSAARARWLRKYWPGSTPQQALDNYNELYQNQDGSCGICLQKSLKLVVDHCHTSGKIRALLCQACNKGIGHLSDNAELCQKAADYLLSHRF